MYALQNKKPKKKPQKKIKPIEVKLLPSYLDTWRWIRPRVYHWIPRGFKFPLILIILRVIGIINQRNYIFRDENWENDAYKILSLVPPDEEGNTGILMKEDKVSPKTFNYYRRPQVSFISVCGNLEKKFKKQLIQLIQSKEKN